MGCAIMPAQASIYARIQVEGHTSLRDGRRLDWAASPCLRFTRFVASGRKRPLNVTKKVVAREAPRAVTAEPPVCHREAPTAEVVGQHNVDSSASRPELGPITS